MTDIINADTISGFPKAKTFKLAFYGDIPVVCISDKEGRLVRFELSREQLAVAHVDAAPFVVRA